jgi:hypothetical protein
MNVCAKETLTGDKDREEAGLPVFDDNKRGNFDFVI